MNKVDKLIKLLHEGNEEVKYFLQAILMDPEYTVELDGDKVKIQTPEGFYDRVRDKVDDILRRNS